jgi:hypothetical protein
MFNRSLDAYILPDASIKFYARHQILCPTWCMKFDDVCFVRVVLSSIDEVDDNKNINMTDNWSSEAPPNLWVRGAAACKGFQTYENNHLLEIQKTIQLWKFGITLPPGTYSSFRLFWMQHKLAYVCCVHQSAKLKSVGASTLGIKKAQAKSTIVPAGWTTPMSRGGVVPIHECQSRYVPGTESTAALLSCGSV